MAVNLVSADITVNTDGSVAVAWQRLTIGTGDPQDPDVLALIAEYVNDPWYQELINTPLDMPRQTCSITTTATP